MAEFARLKHSHRSNVSALARALLPVFGLALMLFTFGLRNANADISLPSNLPKDPAALAAIINHIPGLEKTGVQNIKVQNNFASADIKIKGQQVFVSALKPSGFHKVLFAIAPQEFHLPSFLPIPSGTAADGVKFENVVLVFVSKEDANKNLSVNDLPGTIHKALSHLGSHVQLKQGLNLFGRANISSSGTLKRVLSTLGYHQIKLPLNAIFSTDLFRYDAKTASKKLKNELLSNLKFSMPLQNLTIPGMPKTVKVDKAHLLIEGQDVKGTNKIFASVKGKVQINLDGPLKSFDFDILAGDPGKQWQAIITGSSKDSTKLPFFKPLIITNMKLTAKHDAGKWDIVIDAKSKLNNKALEVKVNHGKDGTSAKVKGKLTLSDLLPKSVTIPGITDFEFDDLYIDKTHIQIQGKVKNLNTTIAAFRNRGKTYVAINIPKTIKASSLISAAKGTPLDGTSLEDMNFIWVPKGGEEKGIQVSALPEIIAGNIKKITDKVNLKEGLNIIGQMNIPKKSVIGNLLSDVGVDKEQLPIIGTLGANLFHPSSAKSIKNEILKQLEFKIKLPALKIPGVEHILTFNHGHLNIKGQTTSGKNGIDLSLTGEADLQVKKDKVAFKMDVEYEKSASSHEFSFKGTSTENWSKPLGIKFLELKNLTLALDKKNGAFDISMSAKTDIGTHSALDVSIDVHEKNGKISDIFFELDGPVKLSEIPGVKDIPKAKHFTIDTLKVSEHGVEAKTDFGGKKDLDIFLFDNSGWNLIIRQDNFTITEIVPPLKHTPLKHIVLSEAAIVLSHKGLQGSLSDFSPIAHDALADIYGKGATHIDVGSGIGLISAFEHKKSKGGLTDAFKRLGLTEERLIMNGDVGGIFGGPAKLNINVDLSAHSGAKNQPKWMKSKPGVTAVFSLIATESDGQFDIEIGIGANIIAKVHGTELDFTAKTALEFQDEKIGIKIVADMKDTKGWHQPFGIPGFTMYEVGFDLGIDEDGAIHIGFDGSIKISGKHYKVAADTDLLPEALGAPQDIAFIGSADKVDMFFIEKIAIAMMGAKFKLDIPGGILPDFTDVKFAFVTPGGSDPDLHIPGDDSPLKGSEGFALQGAMNWFGHELGAMEVAVSPTKGILADGKIDDMHLGPLHLKKNDFYFKASLTDVPTIKVNSDISFIGIEERFKIAFDKTGASFAVTQKFGPDFSMTADLELSGIDLSVTKPNFKNIDFYMEGDFKLDIGKFISGPATDALNDVFDTLSAGFKAAEKSITKAQKQVDDITILINAKRAKVRKEKAAVEAKVTNVKKRIDSLNLTLKNKWSKYHHCHGWSKWPCKIRWGASIGWTKGEVKIADAALDLAKNLVSHFPIDLDPEIATLIIEQDTAKEVLYIAKEAIKGADALDAFLKKATDKLTSDLKDSININKAQFKGDLRGVIEKDSPVDLAIDAEFFGAKVKDTFAFQLGHIGKDLLKDVEKLGLMGLYALYHLVEEGIDDIPGPLKNKIRRAIAKKLDAKTDAHKSDLAKHKVEFDKYNLAAKAIQDRNTAYSSAYLQSLLSESKSPLDTEISETFSSELIEVGHTGLCLDSVSGKVKQDRCTDDDAKRWSTKTVSGTKVAKGGYVNIIQPDSGDCIMAEGDWTSVTKEFSDPDMPKEGSFSFQVSTFDGDGKINIKSCKKSKEYQWKILKHGEGWMQMANLATNKCLHFENSSSIPGESEAQWKSCIGSANQVFRLADKSTPVYHREKIALRNDQLGICIHSADKKGVVSMGDCSKAAYYDYLTDVRGYVKFINRATGNCLQPSSYKPKAKMIEVSCTQLDYQWWDAKEQAGGIIIKNAQTKLCTDPPFTLKDTYPTQVDCKDRHNAVFAPVVKATTGPDWKLVTATTLPYKAGMYDAGKGLNICSFNYNGSFVPGLVNNKLYTLGLNILGFQGNMASNQCSIYYDGKFHESKDKFRVAVSGSGMEWQQSDGTLHWSFIPTGGFGGDDQQTIYTCKADPPSKYIKLIKTPSVGWTVDGNTCFLAESTRTMVTDFKVLSRTKDSYYHLKISDDSKKVSYSSSISVSKDEAKARKTWVDNKIKESKKREDTALSTALDDATKSLNKLKKKIPKKLHLGF